LSKAYTSQKVYHQANCSPKIIGGDFFTIAAIKLERLGLIDKSISSNNNWEYYTYSITPDGIDYILVNEEKIKNIEHSKIKKPATAINYDSFDDDIPF